ncbi:MAG TPA: UDP-glucose/GDP-mannose dehydrogenase family protein [Marmoricola sp.]
MLVSVLGTGYLGATHAACLADWGHEVVGVDSDEEKVRCLAGGTAPFHEPGLDALLREGVDSGRLRFSTRLSDAAAADVHFLCVGTPQLPGSDAADLTALWSLVRSLAPLLETPCTVVGKSTVPVGTAARLRDWLQRQAPAGAGVELAWNPEFLREGHAVEDTLRPDRLVLGLPDGPTAGQVSAVLGELFGALVAAGVPVVHTDLATAELAKASANVMLAARISLVNLLAEVCERGSADIADLSEILRLDRRIGPLPTPGLGYGGGCLPKDSRAFAARAAELGLEQSTGLLREIDATNQRQRSRTVALADALLDGLDGAGGARVAVLGAAFKGGSDDLRDSPALDVALRLQAAGAQLRVHDPRALDNVRRQHPSLPVADSVEEAVRDADLVLVLTEWPEYAALDPAWLAGLVRRPQVLDARLMLDPEKWRAAGWDFHALGRGDAETAPLDDASVAADGRVSA